MSTGDSDRAATQAEERYLEIIKEPNGDVVLQRPRPEGTSLTDEDALVRMRFSPEMLDVLGDDLLDVAGAMVEAAADAIGEVQAREDGREGDEDPDPIVH